MKFRKLLLTLALCAMCVGQASALECVATNSISLAPPQAAGLAHCAAPPFPMRPASLGSHGAAGIAHEISCHILLSSCFGISNP